jgi:hypothetical protein
MHFSLKLILLTLFLGCAFAGCSQDPASVGTKLIPGSEKFSAHDTSIIAIRDTTFKFAGPNGGGANLLVGNYSSVDARTLLQFFTTIPDSLTTVHIDTVKLSLTVSYTWNMGTTPAEFVIREVTTPWSAMTVTVDSLATLNFVPTLSASITDKDSISTGKVVTSQIDSSIVRKWINITVDTSKPRFFSIALVTKPGMTNTGIWGLSQFGTSTPPSLKILYSKNGVRDSIDLNSGSGSFLATKIPFLPSGFIETQAGISIRSKINFNLKPISDSINRAIVNNATMELTLNNAASQLGAGTPDSLRVLALIGGSDARPDSASTAYFAFGYRKTAPRTTDTVYTFSVTSMVQQWISNPTTYNGVVLRSLTDESSVDKLSFYSSKDLTRAPRLLITYTKK